MSKTARILGGKKAKEFGKSFEQSVIDRARHQGMFIIKIPEGCRRVGPQKIIPVKTPFDFIIFGKTGAVYVDAKTFNKNTVGHADMVEHQVDTLLEIEKKGFKAGYLVYLRKSNRVMFITATQLKYALMRRESVNLDECLLIGGLFDFDLQAIALFG